jgi:hypothetical protein
MAKKKIANDNISSMLGGINPSFNDTNDFLDIVQWNLRWFNANEKERVQKIQQVLSVLNSDIFVFQEIAEGSLDGIAKALNDEGKGSYVVKYGNTGGQQRIAVMWDMEWVRAKDETQELFKKYEVTTPSGKDVFPRQPLWNYFYCKSTASNKRGFDFQLVGLHLKSQMDAGGQGEDDLQRTLSCAKLADWLQKDANHYDADAILLGDWNEPPTAKAWSAVRQMEKDKSVLFEAINDPTDFSHLYYRNKNDVGSLLDLRVVTTPFAKEMNRKAGGTIHWLSLETLMQQDATAGDIKRLIESIKKDITDHMPVLTRFGVKKK